MVKIKIKWHTEQIQSESEHATTMHTHHSFCSNFWDFFLLKFIVRSPPFMISKYRRVIYTFTYKNTCILLLISECQILVSLCINILAGLRPCLSVVMVAQLSEADDVVCNDKRQWNGRNQLWQNIFISKWNKLERICPKITYQFLERMVFWVFFLIFFHRSFILEKKYGFIVLLLISLIYIQGYISPLFNC